MYINKITEENIQDDAVMSENENGIVYFQNGCWKFLEKSMYQKVNSSNVGPYPISVYIPEKEIKELIQADTKRNAKAYTYYFGINDFVFANKKFYETSALISDPIDVYVGVPITIKSKIVSSNDNSIEFYIVDGLNEISILPEEQSSVEHEKLFFQMPPRFPDGTNFHIYEDFVSVSDSIDSFEMGNDGALYTVSYIPPKSAYTYTPKSRSIKIKVILRVYKEDSIPQLTVPEVIQESRS